MMSTIYEVLSSLDLSKPTNDVLSDLRTYLNSRLADSWIALYHCDHPSRKHGFNTILTDAELLRHLPVHGPDAMEHPPLPNAPDKPETKTVAEAAYNLSRLTGESVSVVRAALEDLGTREVLLSKVEHHQTLYGYLVVGLTDGQSASENEWVGATAALIGHLSHLFYLITLERTRSAAFEAMESPGIVTTPEGVVIETNPAFQEFFGVSPAEEEAKLSISDFFSLPTEESLQQLFRKRHLARPVMARVKGIEKHISGVLHSIQGDRTPQGYNLRLFYFVPDESGKPSASKTADRRYPQLELPRDLSLTAREIDVAVRIAAGESSKEIAERLNVSIRTIQFHRQSLRDKLDIVGDNLSLRHALLQYERPGSRTEK